jgi:hypothetical protein
MFAKLYFIILSEKEKYCNYYSSHTREKTNIIFYLKVLSLLYHVKDIVAFLNPDEGVKI